VCERGAAARVPLLGRHLAPVCMNASLRKYLNASGHPRGFYPRSGSCARRGFRWGGRYNGEMYHYDPNTALEELTEDATLPNPVHVRDMILRKKLTADRSLELNRLFVEYQKFFGEAQKLGKEILKQLAG
jgi:hypothetical protein